MTSSIPRISLPRKPHYRTINEEIDFFELFRRIEPQFENCFLLESLGEDGDRARTHVIGFDPDTLVHAVDANELIVTDTKTGQITRYPTDNAYDALRELIPQDVIARRYCGGLAGYIGYDSVRFFEPTLDIKTSDQFEAFKFGIYRDGLLFDKMTGQITYFYYEQDRYQQVLAILQQPCPEPTELCVEFCSDGMDETEHAKAVDRARDDICAGLIFQVQLGFKSHYKVQGDTLQIYQKLREVNPSPHMNYVKFGPQRIIGASPELLFRLQQGEMETYPLAGTAKRGEDQREDQILARTLLNDPKEIAEHNMLVDLHRNDIGRVAQFGTVKVRNLMDIKKFSHVQHISSEIVGIIRNDEDMFSALAANFPAGTLTGAPKIEAMKIIDDLEPEGRGPYGGAVGHFGFNGDCAFAIPIRSVFINGEKAYVQTCGGNVYDSNAKNEYLEIQRKFAAMKQVLASFEKASS